MGLQIERQGFALSVFLLVWQGSFDGLEAEPAYITLEVVFVKDAEVEVEDGQEGEFSNDAVCQLQAAWRCSRWRGTSRFVTFPTEIF